MDMKGDGRAAGRRRAFSAEVGILVVQHQDAVADPDLGVANPTARRLDQAERLHRTECLGIEGDRRLGVVHRHVGPKRLLGFLGFCAHGVTRVILRYVS